MSDVHDLMREDAQCAALFERCQCPETGEVSDDRLYRYDPETERPFVNHSPDECRCTNDIRLYDRDGEQLWLCSLCVFIGDREIKQ